MYRVLIYHNDDVIKDRDIKELSEAVKYGETCVQEYNSDEYWYKIKIA